MGGLTPVAGQTPPAPPLVELRGIGKVFGGVEALVDVHVQLRAGAVHSLVGENGAGKSTLGKILRGVHQPSTGRILVDGEERTFRDPADAAAAGIAGISQELQLMPSRTVVENIAVGMHTTRWGFVDRRATRAGVVDLMDRFDLHVPPDAIVGRLPVSQQQRVETLRALARSARLLVFDEPTARLATSEVDHLLGLVETLAASGVTIVYVSHFLDEILRVSNEISILRNGRLVRTSSVDDEDHDSLVEGVTGRVGGIHFPPKSPPRPDASTVLRTSHLTRTGEFDDVSIEVRAGEIVGLAGLVGAGRSEVIHTIFGARPPDRGEIELHDTSMKERSIRTRIASGMALIPESRRDQGLLMGRSIIDNISLPHLSRCTRLGLLRFSTMRERAEAASSRVRLRHPGLGEPVETLSGGNQQKVLFARAAVGEPRLLLADEPTRGVDVGAKQSIYEQIAAMAAEGEAVLIASSEIDEIVGLCHRVYVMARGRVVTELAGTELREHAVMQAAFHVGGDRACT